jgi:hypothetical protein
MPGWSEALDDFETRLLAAAETLRVGGDTGETPAPFETPALGGPCPPELRGRAEQLVELARILEGALRSELASIRDELRRVPRTPAAARPVAGFDAHA